MTDYPYIAPCSYFLIYVYEISGSVDHAGLLKDAIDKTDNMVK